MSYSLEELQEFEAYLTKKPDSTIEVVVSVTLGLLVSFFFLLSDWWYVAVIVDVALLVLYLVHRFHERAMVKKTVKRLKWRWENGESEKVKKALTCLNRDVARVLADGIENFLIK